MTWFRLVGKLQQFELMVVSGLTVLWLAVVMLVGTRLNEFVVRFPDCFGLATGFATDCRQASQSFGGWDQTAELLLWMVVGLPIAIGGLFGAPVVSREIEHRTAQITWSVARSRSEWFGKRTVPVLFAGMAILSIVALGGEYLQSVRLPGEDLGFHRFDQRGILVITRGAIALLLSVLAGALIGRAMPALLSGLILSTFLVFGTTAALDAWRRTESEVVVLTSPSADELLAGAMVLGPVAILPDGSVVESDPDDPLPPGTNYDAVRVIPRAMYATWVGREVGIHAVLAVTILGATVVVVNNRRPS